MKRLWMFLLLACVFSLPVTAEETDTADIDALYAEQWESSGIEDVWGALPSETQDLLNRWGISDFSSIDLTAGQPEEIMKGVWQLVSEESTGPLSSLGLLIGVLILCALLQGWSPGTNSEVSSHFTLVGTIAAYTVVFAPLLSCINRVCEAVESAGVFMTSFIPVYAGVMIAGGQAASALSYQTILLFAVELITMLIQKVVVPCLIIALAFGFTGSVTPQLKLHTAGSVFNKSAVWLLSLVATLSVGLLSLQSMVTNAADSLSGRAIRMSLATFVPVVGGALGEAFNTVKGCLGVLRNTIGGVGIFTTAIIVLPPLVECALWGVGLSVSGVVADMFGLSSLGGLLQTTQSTVKTLIGVLAISALLLIVGTTVVTVAGNKV